MCGAVPARPQRAVFGASSGGTPGGLKCEGKCCATVGRAFVCDAAILRPHDPVHEMKSKAIAWCVRARVRSTVKRFKQMFDISLRNAGAMIGHAQLHFTRRTRLGYVARPDFNAGTLTGAAVFQGVAQEILKASRKSGGISHNRRQSGLDVILHRGISLLKNS